MASLTFPWLRPLWQQLINAAHAGRMPHGMGFSYSPDLGVDTMLEQLAAFLLCQQREQRSRACGECKSCKLWKAGTHPDYLRVEPEIGKQIGVDAVRQIAQQVQQTSSQGGNKVVQIIHADRMTLQAANALLKTLEEPPENTFIQLAASRYSQLLPTIRSRLLAYATPKPSQQEIKQWLQEHSQQAITDTVLIELATTKPLSVLRQLQSNEEQLAYLGLLCKGQLVVEKDLEKVHQMLATLLSEIQFAHRQAMMGEMPLVVATNIKQPAPVHSLARALAKGYRRGIVLRKALQNAGVNPQILVASWSTDLTRSLRASTLN
ncbi:hypothetical protein A28LD_0906 [Idiomarina sp. A28L]|uniref:DNA polymerase III subunit n=1 Tax=Idiomarina sp. A28L TaxID=1036674 RepID=UPI0002138A20|nr:DNA polymerase III subunit [Idiomarina sp. A28L]EGN75855.1 hypothetical protein A28LD_0906 [Idiomarina sp. A28L]